MKVDKLSNLQTYQNIMEYIRVFNEAVKDAQIENHKNNIPNVYSINGEMYFELPNKELVRKRPS
jgi:hypothetical protein